MILEYKFYNRGHAAVSEQLSFTIAQLYRFTCVITPQAKIVSNALRFRTLLVRTDSVASEPTFQGS
jgi:hypothetical protein